MTTDRPTSSPAQIAPLAERYSWRQLEPDVEINQAAWTPQAERVLQPAVVRLLRQLHRDLEPDRQDLLSARSERQKRFDAGELPGFLSAAERAPVDAWRVADLPPDLLCRRVEITGPVNDTKMVINMLSRNSDGHRADAAMLDFEDSMKPSWTNVMTGVENLIGAANGNLTFEKRSPEGEVLKSYELDPDDMPLLMARCRGLHLDESNLRVDDRPVSGGMLDLALCVFHTAEALACKGKTPKYYVPKCEHYLEARWWNTLFRKLESETNLPSGTLRATFLIETLPAAFQIQEILFELRERIAGLNVGRWDKIFSDIKVLREHPDRVMADRASISLNRPWMRNYAELLVKTCHRRGAFAMGGMAAFTPGKSAERRAEQTRKVVEDKQFEFDLGHDGCWVSHPYFIGPALSAFTEKNQIDRIPEIDDQPDLLPVGSGPRTIDGLRTNIRVGIGYMQGWNQDIGCVAWDDLMEDLATLEISRAQIWQWVRHEVVLEDGAKVTPALVRAVFAEELAKIQDEVRAALQGSTEAALEASLASFARAKEDAESTFLEDAFRPFLSSASDLVRNR